jgi:transcriptional regulator with XRE-family HTH domain
MPYARSATTTLHSHSFEFCARTSGAHRRNERANRTINVKPAPSTPEASFGKLLCRLRLGAGLSQEMLAERAGVSVKTVSALESGARRNPYHGTVALLADALSLSKKARARLAAVAVRPYRPREAHDQLFRRSTTSRHSCPASWDARTRWRRSARSLQDSAL